MPENVGPQRTARARYVLWTLAVVTVTAVTACSYVRFGRTSADRDRGNVRSAADANGTARDGTGDLGGPGHQQTRDVDAASGALAAVAQATTTQRRTTGGETRPAVTVTGGAAVRDDATGKDDRSAGDDKVDRSDDKVDRSDDDVSRGFYRATSADGSVRVVHQNVYSTIGDIDDGDAAAAAAAAGVTRDGDATPADSWRRPVHRDGYHYPGRPRPPVPRVEVEERPAAPHRTDWTDWKTAAALAAVAKLASAKLAAVGLLQLAFALGFKLLLVAAAVSVKWLLVLKLGKAFHALAVVPLLLLLAASLSPALVGSLPNRAQASSSGQLQSGGSSSSSSSLQTLPAGSTSLQMVSLPGTSSSEVFQKASRDRERCVEREACRAAAADKAGGVVPAWINRILNGVSKAVPDDKIKLYFKTYNDVNIEMNSTSTSSKVNWESWCLERYDCKGVNAAMTVANNKK